MDRRTFARLMLVNVAACGMASPVGPRSPVGARRYQLSDDGRPLFDVRDFGAIGDGEVDDKTAFWTALDSAGRVNGIVTVPPGTYRLTLPLRIPNGVSLQGEGASSILFHDGALIVLWTVGVQNVQVSDLSITGNFAHGVLIQQTTTATVRSCSIAGATLPRFGYAAGVYIIESTDVSVEGCTLQGNGLDGAHVSSDIQCDGTGQASSNIRIVDNACSSTNVTTNIRCYDTSHAEIRRNRVNGARLMRPENSGYGISLYETTDNVGLCADNLVAENVISDTQGSGIYLNRSHRSKAIGNTVTRVAAQQLDAALPVAGIALNQCESAEVLRNHIADVGRAGISVASNREGAGHALVQGNDIARTIGFGIHLRGLLTDVHVLRNVVVETGGGIGSASADPQHLIVIAGNTISKTRGDAPGILLSNAAQSDVSDNVLEDCGGPGLDLTFHDDTSTVRNNSEIKNGQLLKGPSDLYRLGRPDL